MNAAEYARVQDEYLRSLRYWPGKFVLTIAERAIGPRRADAAPAYSAAADFLDVLLLHRSELTGVPVVVIPAGRAQSEFVRAARRLLQREERHRPLADSVSFVEPAAEIRSEHFYPLDGHLTAAGHTLYARLLADEIARRGLLGG